jgi:transcriptional regulator GlxA family with amidase domain
MVHVLRKSRYNDQRHMHDDKCEKAEHGEEVNRAGRLPSAEDSRVPRNEGGGQPISGAPGVIPEIEFINENLDQEETVALAAVADAVQMSYSHFSRAFKQSMGVTAIDYMIEQRIARTKKLLSETDLPIADIALRVGFASQSHFTTTFRRLVWTTPKAFRDSL